MDFFVNRNPFQHGRPYYPHKFFMQAHLDYGDVVFAQSSNKSFLNVINSIEYNATLAITEAIRDYSLEKLY